MKYEFTDTRKALPAACLVALLATPLVACSERPAEPERAQADTQQMVRDKEAERRPGSEQPDVTANDVDYTDGYSKPRESWTGGTTARDAQFESSDESDAHAERLLAKQFSDRDGFHAVEVDVEGGVAHLRGEVDSVVQHREAETLAEAMEEVVEVRNDLQIAARRD